MSRFPTTFSAALVLAVCSTSLLNASIMFTLGNNPQPNENNILLNTGTTGTTVQGTLNAFPNVLVNFSSSQALAEPSNGQARVSASPEGTPLNNISIALANNLSYGDLIVNPFGGPGGTATVTVQSITATGAPEANSIFTYTLGNGQNFLTILAGGGEAIIKTSIGIAGAGNGINDLRQPRISGPFNPIPTTPPPGDGGKVPEPQSIVLALSGGLLLAGKAAYRKFVS